MPASPPPRHRSPWRLLGLSVAALQRDLAAALDLTPEHRAGTVVAMLASNARRAPGYWIQLTLAMGIATLGLVLGSTAVVIGAMLVSPLMGPIIELGMGFAVGSSLLVIRSFLRVALSVVWVIASAALMTVLLPFHEVTSEIAARTAPTALDLLVAVFCALTAAYTTVRAASDTTAAAAGTAIGIALVPPLCVTGYGIGTGTVSIASGAGLLFTANFSAIVVLAALSFVLLGYNEVDAEPLEREVLAADGSRTEQLAERAHRRLRTIFGSRYGRTMRFLVPALFLLGVYVPLSRALDEVAWQVRVRNAVERLLAAERGRIVQTSLSAEREAVTLRLVTLGDPEAAQALERQLTARVAAIAGVEPTVSVVAVPDAAALAAFTAEQRRAATDLPVPARPDLGVLRQRVGSALAAEWPTAAAGPLVAWTFELPADGEPIVRVRHVGPPLGRAAESLLGNRVTGAIGTRIAVAATAMPADTIVAPSPDQEWMARALTRSAEVAAAPRAIACVALPPATPAVRARAARAEAIRQLEQSLAGAAGRLTLVPGADWRMWIAEAAGPTPCLAGRSPAAPVAPASRAPAGSPSPAAGAAP